MSTRVSTDAPAASGLDRAWIGAHIPHQGNMCLLEEVLSWNERQLRCRSGTHRSASHPLRAHGRLHSACLIEYAAQAVAIHGALLQHARQDAHTAAPALLASARAVDLAVERLDDIAADLLIEAHRVHSDARSALYAFTVHSIAVQPLSPAHSPPAPIRRDHRLLAQGRLSLWLQPVRAGSMGRS